MSAEDAGIFEKIDSDQDGVISHEELRIHLGDMGLLSEAIEQLLEKADIRAAARISAEAPMLHHRAHLFSHFYRLCYTGIRRMSHVTERR